MLRTVNFIRINVYYTYTPTNIPTWRTDGKGEFVHVNDPADSPTTMSGIVAYSELLVPYGTGDWTYTWIEIRR